MHRFDFQKPMIQLQPYAKMIANSMVLSILLIACTLTIHASEDTGDTKIVETTFNQSLYEELKEEKELVSVNQDICWDHALPIRFGLEVLTLAFQQCYLDPSHPPPK